MVRRPTRLVSLIVLAGLGALALSLGSIQNFTAERRRLEGDVREAVRRSLIERARRLEDVSDRVLLARLEAATGAVLASRPGSPPSLAWESEDGFLVLYGPTGELESPRLPGAESPPVENEALQEPERKRLRVLEQIRDSGDLARARTMAADLIESGESEAVRARAAVFLARLLETMGEPVASRRSWARACEIQPGALSTAELWIARSTALKFAEVERRTEILDRLLSEFEPLITEPGALRGLVLDLADSLSAEGAPELSSKVRDSIARAMARGQRLSRIPKRLPPQVDLQSKSPGDAGLLGVASRAQVVHQEDGGRRGVLVALIDRPNMMSPGDGVAAVSDPSRPEIALGSPFRGTWLFTESPQEDAPLPLQSLLAVALILGSLVPLGVGGVLTLRALWQQKEALIQRSEFLATVAHQLKTPVANLRLSAETLASGRVETAEERRTFEEILQKESLRLGNQLDRILTLARLDSRLESKAPLEDVDAEGLLAEALDRSRAQALAKGVSLSVRIPGNLRPLSGDARGLRDGFENVIENAVRYAPPGSTVGIDGVLEGDRLVLRIKDDGPGVDPADTRRIFQRFERGLAEERAGTGTGLGLAIAESGAASCGGSVILEAAGPGGTVFRFDLPLKRGRS